jgi:hypothetical protein
MPFQEGNTLGTANANKPKRKFIDWDTFGRVFLSENLDAYNELSALQRAEQPVGKGQREFMDRYERMLEYFKPKLARREISGELRTQNIVVLPERAIEGYIKPKPDTVWEEPKDSEEVQSA